MVRFEGEGTANGCNFYLIWICPLSWSQTTNSCRLYKRILSILFKI